jgi:hypothetical protein
MQDIVLGGAFRLIFQHYFDVTDIYSGGRTYTFRVQIPDFDTLYGESIRRFDLGTKLEAPLLTRSSRNRNFGKKIMDRSCTDRMNFAF